MTKTFEIKILDRSFTFTGTELAMYSHLAGLMAQVCPPMGTVPTWTVRDEPQIVSAPPAMALAVASSAPIVRAPVTSPTVRTPVTSPTVINLSPAPVREGEINAEGRDRAIRDREAMIRAGFLPDPTVYAIGSQVNSYGVANARQYREEWERSAAIAEPLTLTRDMVRRENRRDVIVSASQLRFTDTGRLRVPGEGELGLTRAALGRLVSGLKIPGGGEYLAALTPELWAHNLNCWFQGVASSDPEWSTGDVKLRLRDSEHGPELYAIVGPGYTAVDADAIAESLLRNLPKGGRGTVFYDGDRIKVDVQWASNVHETKYVAGEVFRAGMSFCSSDTGKGALNGWATLLRNLCLNLQILQHAKKPILHERHFGDDSRIRRSLAAATRQGEAAIGHFINAWDEARRTPLAALVSDVKDHDHDLSGESLTQLAWGIFVAAQKADLVPITRAEVGPVLKAFGREESNDINGVINAFTRFAHTTPGLDPWRAQKIETAATALLGVKTLPWLDPTVKHA